MITQEELEVLTESYISEPILMQCTGDTGPIQFRKKGDENDGSR